jgi:M6 family metalloprotease-like protein
MILGLVLAVAAASAQNAAKDYKSPAAVGPWSFDKYLSHDEVTERLKLLAKQNPQRVRLISMGKSIGGRDLWVCEITDDVKRAKHKPAIYVQGGIHGNEISTVMVTLYFAWQMGANPDRRRSIGRLLRDTTFYVAPSVSPDASQHFATQPNSLWRPRFNFRPHDADGDGKVDEDGYEDLNGDGEISQMYVIDTKGVFVLKDGRMVRDRTGKITPRFRHVGREGLDDDGDGKFSEDPVGGVNLNRNFPVGFRARRDFEGFRGKGPASEPETQAIIKFVREHENINLFFDYHNAANCVFYWIGPDGKEKDAPDFAHMTAIAGRARKELGFTPRPLDHSGVGLSIAWAYGEQCLPACIVELEVGDPKAWGGDVFVKATKFKHPQLGDVWIGNDHKKLPKRNPPPKDIYAQVTKHWEFMRGELKELPKLKLEQPRIVRQGDGFRVTGFVANRGKMPFESHRAIRLGKASKIGISARGAKIKGTTSLGTLAVDEVLPFDVHLTDVKDSVTLVVSHPKGGTLELPVLRPRVATIPIKKRADYEIEDGYKTVDDVERAEVTGEDNGPVFKVSHRKKELRVAVLLGEFRDLKHTVPTATFAASLFGEQYTGKSHTGQAVYGSVRDFYQEMSYGGMNVTGRVFDWVELPGAYEDYRKASFGSSKFRTALEAAVLEKQGADALDGFDGMIFVWAGNPVYRVSCLWPMRIRLKHREGVIAFKTGEFYRAQMAPIGVACHEMGHTFGVNDKYGLGAPKQPMGRWCLMCKGTHGSGESMQHRPFHLCAWCKMVIGWVKPAVIEPSVAQKIALRPLLSSPNECVRVLLKADGSEYVLLTNRRQEGFMTELPSPGLVVLKIGPNTRPSAPQKQVQLLVAHGLGPARKSELQKLDQIAWPQADKTELVVRSEDGKSRVRISGIRRVRDVVYFEIGRVPE